MSTNDVKHEYEIQVGDRVQFTEAADETSAVEHLGKTGTVVHLSYPTDIGASYPNDPFVEVQFDDGESEHFWTEELTVLPPSDGQAPGL